MPTVEETQAWLSRFLDNEAELDRLEDRIEGLRSQLEAPSSPSLTGMPHGGGYEADRIGRSLARIEALEAQHKELLAKSRLLHKEIGAAIIQIKRVIRKWPPRKVILEMRYLDCLEWDEINQVLWSKYDDYDDRYDTYTRKTFRFHAEALEAMRVIVTELQGTGNNTESEDTGK